MLKMVAFDLDGTLGDTFELILSCFRQAVLPYVGHVLSNQELIGFFGPDEEGMMRAAVGDNWQPALNEYMRLYRENHQASAKLFDGIGEMLEGLVKRGVGVVLITGKYGPCVDITLAFFHIKHYFSAIWPGAPTGFNKPDSIQSMRTRFGLEKNEVCYVGDTVADVNGSRQAGVLCLSAGWNAMADVAALEAANPGNVMHTVAELEARLRELTA